MDIESGEPARLFDPTHLLLHPLGSGIYFLWGKLGWQGGALRPSQVLNALGGVAAVGLMMAISHHLTRSRLLAIMVAAGFALSGGIWLLSVDAEYVTIPLAMSLLVLWGVLKLDSSAVSRPVSAILLALATWLAILTYASSVILIAVVVVGFIAQREASSAIRARQLILYLGIIVILILATFSFVYINGYSVDYLQALINPNYYGAWSPIDIAHGGYAFLRSLALYPNLGMNDSTAVYISSVSTGEKLKFVGYYALLLIITLIPLKIAFVHRRWLWHQYRRPILVLAIWTTLYAAFAIYWVPGDITFWDPVLSAWWILVALVLTAPEPAPKTTNLPRSSYALVASITLFLLMANGMFAIIPGHDLNSSLGHQIAGTISTITTDNDLIIVNGQELHALQVEYFTDHLILYIYPDPNYVELSKNYFLQETRKAHSVGRHIYIVDACVLTCGDWDGLMAEMLPRGTAPYWHTPNFDIYELKPLPLTQSQ